MWRSLAQMPCPRTTASRQPRMSPRTWSLLCLEVQTAVAPRGHRLSTLRQGTVRGRAHTERTSATLMELPRVLRDPCFQIRHLTTHRCAPAPSEDTRRLRATSSIQFRSVGTRSASCHGVGGVGKPSSFGLYQRSFGLDQPAELLRPRLGPLHRRRPRLAEPHREGRPPRQRAELPQSPLPRGVASRPRRGQAGCTCVNSPFTLAGPPSLSVDTGHEEDCQGAQRGHVAVFEQKNRSFIVRPRFMCLCDPKLSQAPTARLPRSSMDLAGGTFMRV
mmetsp:Transcript_115241/g.366343  ORF Transcript_115241/g.366343 Transcript_115241/m.366343 type:complete len:275 (-) Transcript_115241:73-897(-)